MKSYREWYGCDNIIRDNLPFLEQDGHPATGAGWLGLLNPDPDRQANVTMTIYSAQLGVDPRSITTIVPPNRMELVELHKHPEVPRNQFFGLGVTSDIPIVPQATQYEFRPWDHQPDATISKVMYPGPLDETEWYFPDGWQGGGPGSLMSWYERETLTLLNPGDEEARVTLTFYCYGHAADVVLWVPPKHLKAVALYDIPGLRFRGVGERQTTMVDFSVRVTSDVPVLPQKTRRAYVQFEQHVQGMWTSFGYPYRLAEKQAQPAVWYYPGGVVHDTGRYPHEDQNMLGWDLFFTFNPNAERSIHCKATFCYAAGEPQVLEFDVQPLRQSLFWLHHENYRHLTGLNQPYAVQIEADGALIPHFTRGEYESWGWHNPTSMFGVVPYEGPLDGQTEWYFAEGFWQDREDHAWIEQEWIAIYNPAPDDATITASFYLPDGVREHRAAIEAGRLTVLRMEEIGVVPNGAHYGVKITGSGPIVVQQTRRTFKKGGSGAAVSTTSGLAIPARLSETSNA